jgi:phospholipase C
MPTDRSHALDHVAVVLFENRSLDNVLGHLYGPEDGKTFEGVIGKDLSNPIPEWAEHGAERKVVPYTVATDMDSPNPDSGEEYPHTSTQLFNILNEHNRFKVGAEITAPFNAPEPGQTPTMDGYVTDYISTFTAETGRQPTYEEYSQIMTGFTPEQIPVLNGLARGFGVFDHRFCEVPSQTLPNRSFWTAATSSGFSVNAPVSNFIQQNTAETIFNRLEDHGKTWKVYIGEPQRMSGTALAHFQRLKDRLATHLCHSPSSRSTPPTGTWPTSHSSSRTWPWGITTTTRPAGEPWATASRSPVLTHRRRSWAVRRSCHGSTTPTRRCSPREGPTCGTRPC